MQSAFICRRVAHRFDQPVGDLFTEDTDMKNKKSEYLELQEHRAMIYLPENAVDIEVIAKVFVDGDVHKVSKKYNMSDIREMFRKADDGYIDDDDRFIAIDLEQDE